MSKRAKVTLYAVCGGYLFYMAYQMFQTVLELGVADSVISLVFSILFVIMGIITWIFTWRLSRDVKREEEEAKAAKENLQAEVTGDGTEAEEMSENAEKTTDSAENEEDEQ